MMPSANSPVKRCGAAHARQEAGPVLPVVADVADGVKFQRVEQPQHVGRQLLLVVAAA